MTWRRAASHVRTILSTHHSSFFSLTGCGSILAHVLRAVSSQKSGSLIGWSWSSWELLVKAHNLLHADSILSGTDGLEFCQFANSLQKIPVFQYFHGVVKDRGRWMLFAKLRFSRSQFEVGSVSRGYGCRIRNEGCEHSPLEMRSMAFCQRGSSIDDSIDG